MNGSVRYEKDGAIAVLTLDRPAARNALTPRMLCQLAEAFTDFRDDARLRVAVLTGTGDAAFCAGGDLGRTLPLLTGERAPQDAFDHRLLNDPGVLEASSLRDFPLPKPVVAAVNGACLAAGFELLLGTDLRVAAAHAVFGLPEVTRALVPFAGALARLPRQIPHALAMELLLTGQPMDAAAALRCGLVNHVLPAADVLGHALALARRIAANGPLAVQAVKRTVTEACGLPLADGYRLEDGAREAVFRSDDAREGPRAFMDRRAPHYQGR